MPIAPIVLSKASFFVFREFSFITYPIIILGFINNKEKQPVWLTGHSLGAALATICAMRLHPRVKGVYTYGSPGVGDQTLVNFCDEHLSGKIFRYVNGRDLVAKALTTKPYAGYHHVGERQLLDIRQSAGLFGFFWDGFTIGLRDHSPLYYMYGTRMDIAY